MEGAVGTTGAALELGVDESLAAVAIQKASLLDGDVVVTIVADAVGAATTAVGARGCPPAPPLTVMVIIMSVTMTALSHTARCTT